MVCKAIFEDPTDYLNPQKKWSDGSFSRLAWGNSRPPKPSTSLWQYTAKDHGQVWSLASTHAVSRSGLVPKEYKLCDTDHSFYDCPDSLKTVVEEPRNTG